jgi:electron transfer flavoprotein beta subunit
MVIQNQWRKINPNDEFGLTRVIWFHKSNSVVNVGGPETEPTLRKALAIELTTLFV